MYPQGSMDAAGSLSGPQFIDKLASLPLHYQPGTVWDYGLGLDVLGLAIEAVTKQPLSRFLNERLFAPLGMVDTEFVPTNGKGKRIARALPAEPGTGSRQVVGDRPQPRKFDCGGACAFSTATDYLRFAQMLLNRGTLDGMRILGRKTVEFMTADQLGPEVNIDRLRDYPNINGYGFGLECCRAPRLRDRGDDGIPRRLSLGRCKRNVLLGRSEGGIGRRVHGGSARCRSVFAIGKLSRRWYFKRSPIDSFLGPA